MPKAPKSPSPPEAVDETGEKADPAPPAKARKERVLHTRIPAVLEQELKDLAEKLRVPVSNVVRTILEDAVDRVDNVGRRAESELRQVAERFGQGRGLVRRRRPSEPPLPEAPLAGVIGYQALRLARDETCTLCGAALPRGTEAHLGIRDDTGPRVLIGDECLPFRAKSGASDTTGGTPSPEEEP